MKEAAEQAPVVSSERQASCGLSAASTDCAAPPGSYMPMSRGCSLGTADSIGYENDSSSDDDLTRELTRELVADFEMLSCTCACGGGGSGGDQQGAAAGQQEQQQSGSGGSCPHHRPGCSHHSSCCASRRSSVPPIEEEELQLSLYEQLGGGVVAKKLVDSFYARVLADPQLSYFFEGVDMSKHKNKFLLFVSYVLGGPDEYVSLHPQPWNQLYTIHERLIRESGLNEGHFDKVKGHFSDAMVAVGADKASLEQAATVLESTRRILFPLPPTTAEGAIDDPSSTVDGCGGSGGSSSTEASASAC